MTELVGQCSFKILTLSDENGKVKKYNLEFKQRKKALIKCVMWQAVQGSDRGLRGIISHLPDTGH